MKKIIFLILPICFLLIFSLNSQDKKVSNVNTHSTNLTETQYNSIKYTRIIDSLNSNLLVKKSELNYLEKLLNNEKKTIDLQGIGTVIVGLLALFFSYKANQRLSNQTKKDLKEKINSYERNEIYKRLNDFYGPLLMLRRQSKILHDIFKNGKSFRTLTELTDGSEYHGNDNELIMEIIKIGNTCKEIIINKSGLIEDKVFRNTHLPNLLVHFTLIEKAYNHDIKGETSRFENYVFPSEIDIHLEEEVDKMQKRLKDLNQID